MSTQAEPKKYRVTFSGRTRGAIGIFHQCSITVEAMDEEGAILKAYETHDHIHFPKVTEVQS